MRNRLKIFYNFIIKYKVADIFVWVFIISINIFYISTIINNKEISAENSDTNGNSNSEYNESCNVQGITLHGDLETYIPPQSGGSMLDNTDVVSSEDLLYYFSQAEKDNKIKAILVEVDSVGGSPVAGEEIANIIKESTKPVVAYIRQIGASASYWAITSADQIFASKNSDVGGIGVTSSYLDYTGQNAQKGLTYIQLSSGKFKDAGNSDKKLTEEEKELFMRDLKIIHANFVEAVSENRNIAIDKVWAIADGSTVLGEKAVELGLVDQIGGYFEAKKYIKNLIGESVEDCWE